MTENQILQSSDSADSRLGSQTNPPHRILVVDDDAAIRRLNSEMLLNFGYEVDVAEDGEAGWQALQVDSYDLLITDNSMPNLSGVGLLKLLHAARLDLPTIMATGKLPQEEFNRFPWLQPAATLVKPYTVEELCRTVKKVLREAKSPGADDHKDETSARRNPKVSPVDEAAVARPPGRTIGSPRILVVDEDQDLRQLYLEALAGPGYRVDVVADGAAGLAALQANPYDLLITEHDLSQLTGIELVRILRGAHMTLPVVMAAARLPMELLARNPWLQFAATLSKPFSVDTLLATVNNILRPLDRPHAQLATLRNWRNQPAAVGLRPSIA